MPMESRTLAAEQLLPTQTMRCPPVQTPAPDPRHGSSVAAGFGSRTASAETAHHAVEDVAQVLGVAGGVRKPAVRRQLRLVLAVDVRPSRLPFDLRACAHAHVQESKLAALGLVVNSCR